MRVTAAVAAGVIFVLACSASQPAPVATPAAACPPADTAQGRWIASVFIDGNRIGARLPARREQEFPETFALIGDEPAELAALPADRIDLIQFSRGPEAEQQYALCPGGVAFLITTRPPRATGRR